MPGNRRYIGRIAVANNDFLFTSESVSEGHPDKVADQISDSILDAIFTQDPNARVAAETLCNTGLVVLAGEITTTANVDYIQVARDTIKRIGYDNSDFGIDYRSEEHTSELQSLMSISYAVFCLKKKNKSAISNL